ncbi:MAG: PhnA domain-containing protein, partial [Saprospiraceae bacterium]
MSVEKLLQERSNNQCELCQSKEGLQVYEVSPSDETVDTAIMVCGTCHGQLSDNSTVDTNHWRCLNDSMWSEVTAVQVVAYRMLTFLKEFDLVDMMYFDDATLNWAKSGLDDGNKIKHIDANGTVLEAGDNVVLIQDLKVKGSSMVAKR